MSKANVVFPICCFLRFSSASFVYLRGIWKKRRNVSLTLKKLQSHFLRRVSSHSMSRIASEATLEKKVCFSSCTNYKTLPETSSSPLKINGWKTIIPFGASSAYFQVLNGFLFFEGRVYRLNIPFQDSRHPPSFSPKNIFVFMEDIRCIKGCTPEVQHLDPEEMGWLLGRQAFPIGLFR